MGPPLEPAAPHEPNPSLRDLFVGFLTIGLLGFGGLAAISHHVMVEQRRWLTPRGFVELFGVASILPGGNILNASVMLGDRHHGLAGALTALGALLAAPLAILLAVVGLYDAFSTVPDVRAAMAGAASAAAGLIFGTATRLAQGAERTAASLAIGLAAFLAVGVLRAPLWLALAVIAPVSVLWALRRGRR